MLTPDNKPGIEAATELALALQEVKQLLDRARQEERIKIAEWLAHKAQTAPAEGRLLYRLLAKDILLSRYEAKE